MEFKGTWSSGTSYSVGDVAQYTDGIFYILNRAAKAGTTCHDARYWGRLDQQIAAAAKFVLDGLAMAEADIPALANNLTTETAGKALDATQGKALKDALDALTIPDNISDTSILLNSSTESSTKQFLITIYDPATGDDPELTITEVVPEEVSEGGET